MNRKAFHRLFLPVVLLFAVVLSCLSCSDQSQKNFGEASGEVYRGAGELQTSAQIDVRDAEDAKTDFQSGFTLTDDAGNEIPPTDGIYRIVSGGTYTVRGKLSDGSLYIEAPGQEVVLVLDGASVRSTRSAPLYVVDADSVKLKVREGTYNEILDAREPADGEEEDETPKGAVCSKADLKLQGEGSLVVNGAYNNGIHCTKDLKIDGPTIKVTARNNALKGKHSVTVSSGNLILIAQGGDGIKTEDTDLSSKGKQRGTIALEGGNIAVFAACDGLDAAYDVSVSGQTGLEICTDTYSPYTGQVVSSIGKTEDFYVIVPSSLHSRGYRFAAFYYGENEETGTFADATYYSQVQGGRTIYYAYRLSRPAGLSGVRYYIFDAEAPDSTDFFVGRTDRGNVNTSMNGYLIQTVSGTEIVGDYVSLSTSSGKGGSTVSAKGIKADNEILISGGTVRISSVDDALHANGDASFESGSQAKGNITVSGGELTIVSGDDGMHADNVLTISGGTVSVAQSHEGLEANQIYLEGGTVNVYGDDDGINAAKSGKAVTPCIYIKGGLITVRTPSGDTDGIDSNGNMVVTGGMTLVMGGSSSGGMSGSVDLDGNLSVTGGMIIALGGICETPSGSSNCNLVLMGGTSFPAGEYTLLDEEGNTVASFSLPSAYSSGWMCSDAFGTGSSYRLQCGDKTVYNWTQSSQSVGTGGSSFGPGGMGGFGGRGGR